jgi:sugar lactone lactonase YvrE
VLWAACLAIGLFAPQAQFAWSQKIQTIAGGGNEDGLLAIQATVGAPVSLAVAPNGAIYLLEIGTLTGEDVYPILRQITPDGRILRVAGTGLRGDQGDGASALDARFNNPLQAATDPKGNLYVVDQAGNRVRRVDPRGVITTFAGTGMPGYSGDDGKATEAKLAAPRGVAADSEGNVYIADTANNRVRKVDPKGIISTLAGTGSAGWNGDGRDASAANLFFPRGLAVDRQGRVYIADFLNSRVRRVDQDGSITTVAGNGMRGVTGDGGAATDAAVGGVWDVAVDATGTLYIAQAFNSVIRRVSPGGQITTVAGYGTAGFNGDRGEAKNLQLNNPRGIAVDANGSLLIADTGNNRVRLVTADGMMTTIAGGPGISGVPVSMVSLIEPRGGVRDAAGNFYVADTGHCRLLKIDPNGLATVIAGTGAPGGYQAEGLKGTEANLGSPGNGCYIGSLAIDARGNLSIPDTYQGRVHRLDANGILTTVAGNGTAGFSGDGGPAIKAQLSDTIFNVALDAQGSLYIADGDNHRVRRVDTNGIISTFAGSGAETYDGDGGKAADAGLPGPNGLAFGPDGSLYITDTTDFRLRRVLPDGTITTVAGTGDEGFSGDGGKATAAQVNGLTGGIAVDAAGNVYLADGADNVIRKINTGGIITSFAGSGQAEFNGDGGSLTQVNISSPRDLSIGSVGDLIFAEYGHSNRIRMIFKPLP